MESIKYIQAQLKKIQEKDDIPKSWLSDERKGVQQAIKAWQKQREKEQMAKKKAEDMLRYERNVIQQGFRYIAGIDEVGRGPLAGPVVSACIIMPHDDLIIGVNDSKQLSVVKREALYTLIMDKAISVGIGVVEPNVIDDINIYQATKVAMQQAIDDMSVKPDYLLIDAMTLENNLPQQAIIKGDATSYSIACASIVAKVVRDRLMSDYAKQYPHYAFEKNAGYGTKDHLRALEQYGITPIHRKSFEPIKRM